MFAAVFSQQPPQPQPPQPQPPAPIFVPVEIVRVHLGLSDEQVKRIMEIRGEVGMQVMGLLAELAKAERDLAQLLSTKDPAPAAVGALVILTRDIRKQVDKIQQGLGEAMLAVLTAEQRARLQVLEEAAKLIPAIDACRALGLLAPPKPPLSPFPVPSPSPQPPKM
jgi:hypothetical protein